MNIEFYPFLELAKFHPPKPVKHRLPEWYKNTPVYGEHFSSLQDFQEKISKDNNFVDYNSPFTIKKCIPVLDYLTSGYLFSHLTDSYIEVIDINGIQGYNWKTPSIDAGELYGGHNHSQCPVTFNKNKHHYIKIGLGWQIKTPPGYSCLFYQPFYDFSSNIKLFPAIVDTDRIDSSIYIPGYITTKESFMINAGDPLVVVFPFKRDEWKMILHDNIVDHDNINFIKILKFKFFEIYKDFFHSKKRYD